MPNVLLPFQELRTKQDTNLLMQKLPPSTMHLSLSRRLTKLRKLPAEPAGVITGTTIVTGMDTAIGINTGIGVDNLASVPQGR